MYIFGVDIPLLELLSILSIVVVVYLIILEVEFRQLRRIVKRFDEEELELSRELRELRKEIGDFKNAITGIKVGAKKK